MAHTSLLYVELVGFLMICFIIVAAVIKIGIIDRRFPSNISTVLFYAVTVSLFGLGLDFLLSFNLAEALIFGAAGVIAGAFVGVRTVRQNAKQDHHAHML